MAVGKVITTYPPDPELAVCTQGEDRLAESCTSRLCRAMPAGVADRAEPVGVPLLELTGERDRTTTVATPPGPAMADLDCPRGGVERSGVAEVALRKGDRPLAMNPSPDVSVDCRPGLDVTDTTFPALDTIERTGL